MADLLTDLIPSTSTTPLTADQLLATSPSELNSTILHSSLGALPDSEALSTCAKLLLAGRIDDSTLVRIVVDLGLARSTASGMIDRRQADASAAEEVDGMLVDYAVLSEMRRRLETYEIISPSSPSKVTSEVLANSQLEAVPSAQLSQEATEVDEGMELDDPWGEDEADRPVPDDSTSSATPLVDPWDEPSSEPPSPSTSAPEFAPLTESVPEDPPPPREVSPIPISLKSFLTQPIPVSAIELASSAALSALKTICQRHHNEIDPYRFTIVEAIPGWVPPSDIEAEGLLPAAADGRLDNITSRSESESALSHSLPPHLTTTPPYIPAVSGSHPDLTAWYTSRILSLDTLGLLDIQLAWVQHGASLGVTSLDELGEDLSLLSRLAYDANLTPAQQAQWTLAFWRAANEADIISAYLANSTPQSVVGDIKRLVMPYLYVLESRAERLGKADPKLVERTLYGAVLSLRLELALPVFETSKATVAVSERLIKNDLDVARLALAILYGSEEREAHVWGTMSSIFECLPVWELSGSDPQSDSELTATTLDSIATFIRPTTASAPAPTPKDLFLFFHPLPFASLSRALDILDVHLESGEILARWKTPVQLRFLLQSSRNEGDQRELAEKLMRRQASRALNDDGWRRLWEDMNRLAGGEDSLLRGALGMLDEGERARIYLGGVLSSGNFEAARTLIKRLKPEGVLDDRTVEEVVLRTSKEFYLSAESGNIHTGEMKSAYDCLAVAPSSPAILSERKYIEATSRLSSFTSLSLTPVEIRHTSDPLMLISRVLSTSVDGYRYPDLMLELADKLGCGGEVERGLVLGMIGSAAQRKQDWEAAKESVEGMVRLVRDKEKKKHRRAQSSITSMSSVDRSGSAGLGHDHEAQLWQQTWQIALSLASQVDYSDIPSKLNLLGYAIEFCPSSSIPQVLSIYRQVEIARAAGGLVQNKSKRSIDDPNLSSGLVQGAEASEERVLGSRTAARAAKLALDLGERFHLRGLAQGHSPRLGSGISTPTISAKDLPSATEKENHRGRSTFPTTMNDDLSRTQSRSSSRTRIAAAPRELFDTLGHMGSSDEAERVRAQARRALVRGVGWLLGAEEGEITA